MVKTEIRAIPGFEREFDNFIERKAQLAIEIENKKAEAIAKVDADYANYASKLDSLISQVSETIEVEIPEEPTAIDETEIQPVEEQEPLNIEE